MNRFTKWNGKKWILPQNQWREIAERLAAYENTGLEPWEIATVIKPKMYTMEIFAGDCYHKEIWYGLPGDCPKRQEELRAMAKEWGWTDAIIAATEI